MIALEDRVRVKLEMIAESSRKVELQETVWPEPPRLLNADDLVMIRALARERLDGRGMGNSKPGLWFLALERIEAIVGPRIEDLEGSE